MAAYGYGSEYSPYKAQLQERRECQERLRELKGQIDEFLGKDDLEFCESLEFVRRTDKGSKTYIELAIRSYRLQEAIRRALEEEIEDIEDEIESYEMGAPYCLERW